MCEQLKSMMGGQHFHAGIILEYRLPKHGSRGRRGPGCVMLNLTFEGFRLKITSPSLRERPRGVKREGTPTEGRHWSWTLNTCAERYPKFPDQDVFI